MSRERWVRPGYCRTVVLRHFANRRRDHWNQTPVRVGRVGGGIGPGRPVTKLLRTLCRKQSKQNARVDRLHEPFCGWHPARSAISIGHCRELACWRTDRERRRSFHAAVRIPASSDGADKGGQTQSLATPAAKVARRAAANSSISYAALSGYRV